MKTTFNIFLLLLVFISCNNPDNQTKKEEAQQDHKLTVLEKHHTEVHQLMVKQGIALENFETLLIKLYTESEKEPNLVIEQTEELINKINKEDDSLNINGNKLRFLYELRAEIFYKNGLFKKSIEEIYKESDNLRHACKSCSLCDDACIKLASNYIGLNNYKKAKVFIDSTSKGYYIYKYALGNYYESINNKDEAIKVYTTIKKNEVYDIYVYYKLTLIRLEELKKKKPKLLHEIYYPTGRPNFQILENR